MQSSLQSRLVVQKTMIRLLPPAPYTLTISLIVLDRLVVDRGRAGTTSRQDRQSRNKNTRGYRTLTKHTKTSVTSKQNTTHRQQKE